MREGFPTASWIMCYPLGFVGSNLLVTDGLDNSGAVVSKSNPATTIRHHERVPAALTVSNFRGLPESWPMEYNCAPKLGRGPVILLDMHSLPPLALPDTDSQYSVF